MGEIGSGTGSSYPTALDTDNTPEVNSPNAGKTKARAEVPNDLASATVAIETELGTDPAGTTTDVKTYLQTEHNTDGTHDDTKVVLMTGSQTIAGSKTFSNTPVVENAAPAYGFVQTGASADNGIWDLVADSEIFRLRLFDDGAGVQNAFTLSRSGDTPVAWNFISTSLSHNGNAVITAADSASTTVEGVVELATSAETITGTDTGRVVTPSGLQAKVSSVTAKGIVELATSAETITGSDTDRAVTPAGLQAKVSSTTAKGIVELATDAETQTGTDTERAVTPAGLLSAQPLLTKVINIGDWNMDTTSLVNVAHGLTKANIRDIRVTILDDTSSNPRSLLSEALQANQSVVDGYWYADTTNVVLQRVAGGNYDTATYDSTSFNRGWVIIGYVP